jgi:hypothetical protein
MRTLNQIELRDALIGSPAWRDLSPNPQALFLALKG